jgi:AcrR family transcriptional regulator
MTIPESQPERRGVGRPRSAKSHQAILDATLEVVAEEGIQGASIEAIAARAGVGKTTIYRRWSSKEELILDAVRELNAEREIPDTGDVRQDLISWMDDFARFRQAHPLAEPLMYRLLGEAHAHPEFLRILSERVFAPRGEYLLNLLKQAQARGEIDPGLDPAFVASLIGGPFLYMWLLTIIMPGFQPPDDLPRRVIDAVLHGIGA